MAYSIKALTLDTCDDFDLLAQRHNGVWGGCWCVWFHQNKKIKLGTAEKNKALKHSLVMQGRALVALFRPSRSATVVCGTYTDYVFRMNMEILF